MTIDQYYLTTFTAKRMVWATDGSGNKYSALENIASFNGHMQQSSMELAQSLNLQFTKAYTIFCSTTEDVAEGDQLVSGGFTYTVKTKQEFLNGDNAHLELVCERTPYNPA
ncbi:MAG: hypothetical protein E6Q97_32165 [Desulfurellales bacterium]|nr:MAG: hypothetical protein E6Q97_32165 [Desulfurellales bacterium]